MIIFAQQEIDERRGQMASTSHDSDIREELFEYLEDRYPRCRIFEEKVIGRSRADAMLVLCDRIVGIEIKADNDTYDRLKKQVRSYDRYFDENIVAVGSTHAAHAAEHVPDYWGILSIEVMGSRLDFYEVRPPKQNPKRKRELEYSILWKDELTSILAKNGMHLYKGLSKAKRVEKLIGAVDDELLIKQVCEELMQRDYSKYEEDDDM